MAAVSAYSSASHVDSATVRCLLAAQLTGSPLILATHPLTDLRSVLLLAQSASAYADTCMEGRGSTTDADPDTDPEFDSDTVPDTDPDPRDPKMSPTPRVPAI